MIDPDGLSASFSSYKRLAIPDIDGHGGKLGPEVWYKWRESHIELDRSWKEFLLICEAIEKKIGESPTWWNFAVAQAKLAANREKVAQEKAAEEAAKPIAAHACPPVGEKGDENPTKDWISNSTIKGLEKTAGIGGWISNIWGDAAKYTLEGLNELDVAGQYIKGIRFGARTIGFGCIVLNIFIDLYKYDQNPTWGNIGRLGVDGAAMGVSYFWPGPGTAIGIGSSIFNAAGGFDDFYNFLDANQFLYNSTGHVLVPGLIPFIPIIKIKLK